MPVSGDTVLRLIRATALQPITPPQVVGIDDWAWHRGQRYGTIICDLERNQVIDLLPDRHAGSVETWLKRYPGIEIIARDRAGVYADGARRGAPDAVQVADRWHLLSNLGDALRHATGRHRRAVQAAGHDVWTRLTENCQPAADIPAAGTRPQQSRAMRREQRRDTYATICRLRAEGLTPRLMVPIVGMNLRSIERWLAAGGEPEHRRVRSGPQIIDPFKDHLVRRWQEGCRVVEHLLREIREQGFRGSRVTVARWAATHRQTPMVVRRATPTWRPPSRRCCAWLLSQDPSTLDADDQAFLANLTERVPELGSAGALARRFASLLRGKDDGELDLWVAQASDSELGSLAKGIGRDIDAVRAAILLPWSTSPVEGQINRVKAIKRQMYGRAHYPLLRQRVLIAA